VKRLRDLKSIVDAKFSAEAEPENQKLAVDAEVLKAEAALAAESSGNQASPPPPAAISSSQNDPLSGEEAERIWNVLGVKVRAASTEELNDERYAGGAIITEVRPGGPADGMAPLRADDIILQVGNWEVTSPHRLAFILTQSFTHWSRPSGKLLGIVTVYRGKGNRRGMVQNSMEFRPESVVAPPPPAAEWPGAQLASTSSATTGGTRPTSQIRSPDEFRRELRSLEELVERGKTYEVEFAELAKKGKGDKIKQLEELRDRNRRDLAFLREEYGAQIRLLELEVQDAQSAFVAAEKERGISKALHMSASVPLSRVNEAERAAEAAKLRLERSKTMLELYTKADPIQKAPEKSASEEDKPKAEAWPKR
jgi:hypothetical protein